MSSDKRRTSRRPIHETFSLFVVLPTKEYVRLPVHDISDLGIAFDLDAYGEEPGSSKVKKNDELEMRFYMNQSLYLPLKVKVVRIFDRNGVQCAGAEFTQTETKKFKSFLSFLNIIDELLSEMKQD